MIEMYKIIKVISLLFLPLPLFANAEPQGSNQIGHEYNRCVKPDWISEIWNQSRDHGPASVQEDIKSLDGCDAQVSFMLFLVNYGYSGEADLRENLIKASCNGYPMAIISLLELQDDLKIELNAKDIRKLYTHIFDWLYWHGVVKDSPSALRGIGLGFIHGLHERIPKDIEHGVSYLKEAAAFGDKLAQEYLLSSGVDVATIIHKERRYSVPAMESASIIDFVLYDYEFSSRFVLAKPLDIALCSSNR